jgi:glucokinase
MKPSFVGIEIGGTKLQLVSGTALGPIVSRHRLAIDPAAGAAGIRAQIAETLPILLKTAEPQAIGVGFGGPVDRESGTICCSHHVEGWGNFALAPWLQSISGLPARVENDANVACLGEALAGAGVGEDPVLYVTLGSGVGGGLVASGQIYHGAVPGEVEIGHLRLDQEGTTVESRCSGWAMDRRTRLAIAGEPKSLLAQAVGVTVRGEARYLGAALTQGCPVAERLITDWAADLAFGLSHAVHLLHPSLILLGGGLSLLGDVIAGRVAARLPAHLMEAFRPGPKVRIASLGEDAVPRGALILAQAACPGGARA